MSRCTTWFAKQRARSGANQRANKVETPLLLIHGELDFIPIQQAEEFFTALYRQDKRVTLLRYAGEAPPDDGRMGGLSR